jgi:dipeptidyl aminopeptidase/acylaminoacyl peptidase
MLKGNIKILTVIICLVFLSTGCEQTNSPVAGEATASFVPSTITPIPSETPHPTQTLVPTPTLIFANQETGIITYLQPSPAGYSLAFSSLDNKENLFLSNINNIVKYEWAQNYLYIAFTTQKANQQELRLYIADIHTGEIKPINQIEGDVDDFSWQPKGDGLLFSNRRNNVCNIYLLNDINKEPVKLNITPETNCVKVENLIWSPGGDLFGFIPEYVPDPKKVDRAQKFYRVNGELISLFSYADIFNFKFIPNTDNFLSSNFRGLYLHNFKTVSNLKNIYRSPWRNWLIDNLAASPSGNRLAFRLLNYKNQNESNIYLMDFSGSKETQIAKTNEGSYGNIFWLNDDNLLYFTECKKENCILNRYSVETRETEYIKTIPSVNFIKNLMVVKLPDGINPLLLELRP